MAMNKKEQEYVESLKIKLALRFTEKVDCDVEITEEWGEVVNGYSFNLYAQRVEKSCSSRTAHSLYEWDKTSSQRPIKQYSSRLRALKAMRYAMEMQFAEDLREIDKIIEAENESCT